LLVGLTPSAHAQNEIIPIDASWRFLSPDGVAGDPGDADANFDTTWFTAGFDDSSWDGPEPGPFEYGGINAFANFVIAPLFEPFSGDRYTNYFRHEFTTTQPLSNLGVDILADDGAVIYLDGERVLDFACCDTPEDDYLSFATGGNEDTFVVAAFPSNVTLAPGDHLLAVSVHQSGTTSSDLGFGMRLLSDVPPPPPDPCENPAPGVLCLQEGVDTLLAEAGQMGPDTPHGDLGAWEWDQDDGGGQNHGLIKFDIPQDALAGFGDGKATLRLHVANNGNSADVHRVTSDWLSGPDGGDNVTWNTMPNGPGLFAGDNTEADPSFMTGDLATGQTLSVDVTADVQAWAAGAPNYGWGFIPTGGDGSEVDSFESADPPTLVLEPAGAGTAGDFDNDGDADIADVNLLNQAIDTSSTNAQFDLTQDGSVNVADLSNWVNDVKKTWIGDANLDGEFGTADFVQVFQRGEYEDAVADNSGWDEGDWNADREFNSGDFVAAFQAGGFEKGPKPAQGAAVPEPTGLAIVYAGVFLLVSVVRRAAR
jgi:hypothetical protein